MQGSISMNLRAILAALALGTVAMTAQAQKKYDTGASDTEIKIGNISPYSGPASSYGAVGKTAGAYFDKINAEGGINGRKIKYISVDDGYNPAKMVEQARKLVEQDEVLLLFAPVGTPGNTAIHKYMNAKKVPQLFISSGAVRWNDPKNFPWTMGWTPSYQVEAKLYAHHILATKPAAKIAVLFQNDDFGKDLLKGFLDGMGDKAKTMIVAQASYETSDPTIDSQLVTLKASGADTFINLTTPKFTALAIRKMGDLGWKPTHYMVSTSNSVTAVLKPAGIANSTGIISATFTRDPVDPRWKDSKELAEFNDFMKKFNPTSDPLDAINVLGYSMAQTLVQVLKQSGDNLTRANVMKEASNLNMTLPMLYPGVNIKTGLNDFNPIERMQMIQFNGTGYDLMGSVAGPQ